MGRPQERESLWRLKTYQATSLRSEQRAGSHSHRRGRLLTSGFARAAFRRKRQEQLETNVSPALPAMGKDFVSVQADFVDITMALVEDPINPPARNHFSRLEQCGARTESHEAYLVARGTKYLRLRAKVMGCLPLALQESPGLLRYEVQPGAACNARFLRTCGTTGKKYRVKAQPEPAVHPSGRFHTDLIR